MSIPTMEQAQQDELAMTVARVLAIANEAATAQGLDRAQTLVTITEESEHVWRIHYGPRDYKRRRGGDLMVLIDDRAGVVQRIIRGQ